MNALEIHDLTKTYSNGFQALKGISFSVEAGDFFALLGVNGAGKSTTINIINSLTKKTSGKVSVFGYDIDKQYSLAKSCIGIVPQEFNFNGFETVINIVLNQAGYYGIPRRLAKQRAEKYLNIHQLTDKRNERGITLSGGLKRRLMIARALIHEPKMLILDEPTAGVDIEIRRSMWQFLREINRQGTTILLTTHYLEEAEQLCRNVAIIDQGEIIKQANMKQLLKQLNMETFVLDLAKALDKAPTLASFICRLPEPQTLEIDLQKEQAMNDVFAALNQQNIQVLSMRNKANRLEELFIHLVGKNHETG